MEKNLVLKKNPNMVTRVIDGEAILMPVYKSSDEINCIYTLDKAASRVWNLIDGKKAYSKIKAEILKEFDVTDKDFDKEMAGFLKDLKEIKAVI